MRVAAAPEVRGHSYVELGSSRPPRSGANLHYHRPMQTARADSAASTSKAQTKDASGRAARSALAGPIYPYEPPHQLAGNLWQVQGSLSIPGVPRYMTIYRLRDGSLLLYSVIAMREEGMRALEALGPPAIMVMPHDRHQMDAPFYKQRYQGLRVLAPDPSRARRVPVDADLSELAEHGIRAYPLPGATYHEAILELPVEGGVAVSTCELLGNTTSLRGFIGVLMRVLGPPGGGFGVSRAVRWREVVDRKAVRTWLRGLADRQDVRMILLGHGAPVITDVSAALGHAALEA